jgi:hypothetical protein
MGLNLFFAAVPWIVIAVIDGFGKMKRGYPDPAFEKSFIRTCLSTMWLKQSLKLIVLVACMTAVIFQVYKSNYFRFQGGFNF